VIKFLRKIRQRLLSENKFSKYLLYALGEIILVVIGILIALQINNWNEERKNKIQELKILRNFKNVILEDLERLDERAFRFGLSKESIDYLIEHLEQERPYNDSLKFHFANVNVNYIISANISVFENLRSKGFDLIVNEVLRNKIISFYDYVQNEVQTGNFRYNSILDDASKTIYSHHFDALYEPLSRDMLLMDKWPDMKNLVTTMEPLDYETLL